MSEIWRAHQIKYTLVKTCEGFAGCMTRASSALLGCLWGTTNGILHRGPLCSMSRRNTIWCVRNARQNTEYCAKLRRDVYTYSTKYTVHIIDRVSQGGQDAPESSTPDDPHRTHKFSNELVQGYRIRLHISFTSSTARLSVVRLPGSSNNSNFIDRRQGERISDQTTYEPQLVSAVIRTASAWLVKLRMSMCCLTAPMRLSQIERLVTLCRAFPQPRGGSAFVFS